MMSRILIVDDDPDILEIIRLELEDDPDYAVDTCITAAKALASVNANQYDVIIADWRMPFMNGTELVKTLRAQGCTSDIIIYSGKGMGQEIREALDSGADYYLNRRGDPGSEFAELKMIIKIATGRDTGLVR